jgi:hypothetical protein
LLLANLADSSPSASRSPTSNAMEPMRAVLFWENIYSTS